MVRELLTLSSSATNKKDSKAGDFNKLFTRIEKYEGISDNMEIEIARYLEQVSDAHLSDETKQKIRSKLREISELESIGDACFNLARTMNRLMQSNKDFTEKQYKELRNMIQLTDDSLTQMNVVMQGRYEEGELRTPEGQIINKNETFRIENDINQLRHRLKEENARAVNEHEYDYTVGTLYVDMINELEKLGDYVVNVIEARFGRY
jgi:phosphate:Na+ symporter